jgi:hypothetical protein
MPERACAAIPGVGAKLRLGIGVGGFGDKPPAQGGFPAIGFGTALVK